MLHSQPSAHPSEENSKGANPGSGPNLNGGAYSGKVWYNLARSQVCNGATNILSAITITQTSAQLFDYNCGGTGPSQAIVQNSIFSTSYDNDFLVYNNLIYMNDSLVQPNEIDFVMAYCHAENYVNSAKGIQGLDFALKDWRANGQTRFAVTGILIYGHAGQPSTVESETGSAPDSTLVGARDFLADSNAYSVHIEKQDINNQAPGVLHFASGEDVAMQCHLIPESAD